MTEARRSARVATKLLVAVEDIDPEPVFRVGDISSTGIYFETDKDLGEVGTIQWLHIQSVDRLREVRAIAYVVRTIQLQDVGGSRLGGVALEFMPETDEAAGHLQDFVRYVLALRHQDAEARVAPRLDAHIEGDGGAGQGMVRQLSVRSMVLDTNWAIEPGERVRVDLVAPGMTRRIRLEGRAVRVAPNRAPSPSSRFQIEVEVQQETERPLSHQSAMSLKAFSLPKMVGEPLPLPPLPPPRGTAPFRARTSGIGEMGEEELSRTLDDLLSALILPPQEEKTSKPRAHHLSGQLSRIRLPTLCSLFDMERMTGLLVMRKGQEEARVFVKDGQIVDAEPAAPGESARAKVGAFLRWEEGSFEFYEQPVDRPNRIGLTTTGLLLELAREEDEARRNEPQRPA